MKDLSSSTSWRALLVALVVAGGLAACTGPDDERGASGHGQPFETAISRSQAAAADAQHKAEEAAQQARQAQAELARSKAAPRGLLSHADAAVSDAIRAQLQRDRQLANVPIDVQTVNGVVWLRGEVPSDTARASAERLARSIPGVTTVRNRLDVSPR